MAPVMRLVWLGGLALGLVACDAGSAPKAPPASSAPPPAAAPSAASKPTEAAPTTAAAQPVEAANAEATAPDAPAEPLPVAADFEAEADSEITEKTYKAELESLEKAIATDTE